MHKKRIVSYLVLLLGLLAGCSSGTLETEKIEVEGSGLTYTFQLPIKWKEKEDFQTTYGTQAVYGAEDSMSNSEMVALIFPKDSIEKEGFGARTREELARNNSYNNPEDVYMKEYEIDGAPAYKYTFETYTGGKKKWAHYYCIFSENGILQLMYYSAQDSGYEERVKIIDESVDTVRETAYDKEQNEQVNNNAAEKGNIILKGAQTTISIAGLRQVTGEDGEALLAIRFQIENTGEKAISASEWLSHVQLKQGEQLIENVAFSENNTSYELKTLTENAEKNVQPKETIDGAVIYRLKDETTIKMTMDDTLTSEQSSYSLTVPEKK